MQTVDLLTLNRWTLHRQMLLERHDLDPVSAIELLAGMQAQYSPSPYIGLWSRLRDFQRDHLEQAVLADRVIKATLMRGTLHLVSAREFGEYRVAARFPNHVYSQMVRTLHERGVNVEEVRTFILEIVSQSELKRSEVRVMARHLVPDDLPEWAAWSTVALSGDLINMPQDALFGYFGGTRYRLAPDTPELDQHHALERVVRSYFSAFGPATRADLAQWSGQNVGLFAEVLDRMEFVHFRAEDGRTLLDLPEAPRVDVAQDVPVKFLPKWDNVLLAYDRRERVLPERHRKRVIRKNGDVLPTFLVDGVVAGTWEAPLRGKAELTLTPLDSLSMEDQREVEAEAERLLDWLRPDAAKRAVRWAAL